METTKKQDAYNSGRLSKLLFTLIIITFSLNGFVSYAQEVAVNLNSTEETISSSSNEEIIEFNSLSGDWFGMRTKLFKKGIDFNFSVKNDFLTSYAKGSSGSDYLNLFDFNFSADLNELFGWENANLFVQALGINGTAPEIRSGALQGISNIASPHQWRLYQFWIDKQFFENSFSVAVGLFDLNSEFDVRKTSGVFLNPSFGIGADFSRSGLNGPSIFPSTSFALRLKFTPSENIYLLGGVFDAVPANHNEPYLSHIFGHKDEGVLITSEIGILQNGEDVKKGFGRFNFGMWFYPQKYDDLLDVDLDGNPIKRLGNSGIYINAEKFLLAKNNSDELGLSGFARFGFADKNINAVQTFWAFGINYTGLFSESADEIFGLAVTNARVSDKFAVTNAINPTELRFNETIIEATYTFNPLTWVRIQPDLQIVINPNQIEQKQAIVGGVRVELSF